MSVSLKTIVDVDVQVSRPSAISSSFNLGLIIGTTKPTDSQVLHSYDYSSYATEMVSDGYAATSAEYKAAQVYFSQANHPENVLIGYYGTTDDASPAACILSMHSASCLICRMPRLLQLLQLLRQLKSLRFSTLLLLMTRRLVQVVTLCLTLLRLPITIVHLASMERMKTLLLGLWALLAL